jgi:predicted nucleotidyltransferase
MATRRETTGAEEGGRRLQFDRGALDELCRRHGILRLALFGSELKGTARPDSDLDLLVDFEPGETPGFLGLAAIEEELSLLFGGRRIDLRTPQDLSRHFLDSVLAEAVIQYAR